MVGTHRLGDLVSLKPVEASPDAVDLARQGARPKRSDLKKKKIKQHLMIFFLAFAKIFDRILIKLVMTPTR